MRRPLGIPAANAADHPVRALPAGTRPAWATAKADKGATSDGARVSARVYHDVTDDPTGSGLAVARVDFVNGYDATGGPATSVRGLGKDGSLTAVKGYDDVTGVGSPAGGYVESYRRH